MVLGWSLPRRLRESRRNRERLEQEVEAIVKVVNAKAAIANHTASRLERAATDLMERHNQALIDAAAELRRK